MTQPIQKKPRVQLTHEQSEKLDLLIAEGKLEPGEIASAVGATKHNVYKRTQRRRGPQAVSKKVSRGQSTVSIIAPNEASLRGQENCPSPIDIRAELQGMLNKLQKMEEDLKAQGPAAAPGIVILLAEQRKTIETLLKAEVVFANMPGTFRPEVKRFIVEFTEVPPRVEEVKDAANDADKAVQ